MPRLTGDQVVGLVGFLVVLTLVVMVATMINQNSIRDDNIQRDCQKMHGTWDGYGCKFKKPVAQ